MDSKKTYSNYENFYLARNDASARDYQKRCRGFDKKLSSILPTDKNAELLDIGCGCGFLVYYLKSKGFNNVTAIDFNEQLIELAKSRIDADFFAGDAMDFIKFKQQQYDIIFLWNVLEHIDREEIVSFLNSLHNSLRPDGYVILRTPNMTNFMAQGHICDDFTHVTGLTEQGLEQVSLQAGFSEIEHLNQFKMQNFKGRIKAVLNWMLHKYFLWLRGGTKPKVYYRTSMRSSKSRAFFTRAFHKLRTSL